MNEINMSKKSNIECVTEETAKRDWLKMTRKHKKRKVTFNLVTF